MGLEFNSPIVLLVLLLLCITKINAQQNVFSVLKFGGIADGGKTDNAKAFLKTWKEACASTGSSEVRVPEGTYLVSLVVFEGPCKASSIHFNLQGVLMAANGSNCVEQKSWVTFQYLSGLTLSGGGTLDGQGTSAWHCNDCSKNSNCKTLPTSLVFNFVNGSYVNNIKSINSKSTHMHIFRCDNMKFKELTITAPGDSPNTDGMHVATSTNIDIAYSKIETGDDCISMLPGTKFVHVSNVMCGPGHGISIGSLGRSSNYEEIVTDLVIENCTFTDTMNGLRIKTWAPSNVGLVRNVTFQNIFINNAGNPIIIDQQYCPSRTCDTKASSKVQISDIKFSNVWGKSSTKVAVNLLCSSSGPCQNIELTDINMKYNGNGKEKSGPATSFCANVKGVHHGIQKPPACF